MPILAGDIDHPLPVPDDRGIRFGWREDTEDADLAAATSAGRESRGD